MIDIEENGLTPEQVKAAVAEAEALLASARAQEEAVKEGWRQGAIERIKADMGRHGITIGDLQKRPPHPCKGKKVEAKFIGPNGDAWSGRGRLPRWAKDMSKDQLDQYKVSPSGGS